MPNAMIWVSSMTSTLLVSSVSLVGLAALGLDEARLRRVTTPLVALGVGTLLGDAFIHLVPNALESAPTQPLGPSLRVLAGVLVFFAMDRLTRPREGVRTAEPVVDRQLVTLNLVGDGVHNFIDGVLIAAGYLASPEIGLSTTLAVVCHELPQELADFGILVHAGLGVWRAIALNLVSASAAVLGTVCTLALGAATGPALTRVLIPFAAGGFVYLASARLMPELQRDRGPGGLPLELGLIALGIALMALLALLE